MKKHLITMLLALMLALLCVPAMAEVTVETITYRCPDCAMDLRYRYYKEAVPNTCEMVVQVAFVELLIQSASFLACE